MILGKCVSCTENISRFRGREGNVCQAKCRGRGYRSVNAAGVVVLVCVGKCSVRLVVLERA